MNDRRYRFGLPVGIWLLLAVSLVLVALLQGSEGTGDNALNNVLTFFLTLATGVTTALWLVFFSAFERRTRTRTGWALLALAATFLALFRIESVGAELRPRFVWRFAEAADRRLEAPVGTVAGRADLATTGPWDFPQFLGPRRDVSVDAVMLARDWDAQPPQLLWRQPIGGGWSGFAVVNGYAVTQEQRGDLEMVTCYEVESGELVWSYALENRYESVIAGDGPRATPTIDEGMVYAMSSNGVLLALNGSDGTPVWQHDIPAEYGLTPQQELTFVLYGRANSPLIVDRLVIVPAGGDPARRLVSLVAFDKLTGEKVWEGGDRQISYASPAVATVAGVEQVLVMNEASVSGHYVESGAVLWEFPRPGNSTADPNNSQAVAVPPDKVLVTKGYGLGAALLQLVPRTDGTMDVREVWSSPRVLRTKFSNVTIWEGHIYGLSDGILECVDIGTGERVWKHGRYHHGQILRVHDLLLVLSEDGEVFLIEASPQRRNNVLGQFRAFSGKTWNNFALYGPYLVVRNGEEAAAFRLPLAE
ncbi:MAG: PQQ-binding-like beta-propeller repeat protein [Acidobacteriota bacterium]|jgi:outer membrane protein assembly factor BamB